MRKRLLSMLALLLMAVMGAKAQSGDATMLATPLTIEVKTGGTLQMGTKCQYTLNGGDKQTFTANSKITVQAGEYYNGVFKIKQDGSLSLTYYSPDSKYGQIEEFGYYKVGNPEEKILLDSHLTGNETVTIKNLKAGDEIAFYMDSKKSGEVMIYSSNVTLPNSTTYFYEKDYGNQDYGYTFGDTKWKEGRALAWKMGTNPAPSGQPLPGALTTMLIAGGCAAYLKRRKSARK